MLEAVIRLQWGNDHYLQHAVRFHKKECHTILMKQISLKYLFSKCLIISIIPLRKHFLCIAICLCRPKHICTILENISNINCQRTAEKRKEWDGVGKESLENIGVKGNQCCGVSLLSNLETNNDTSEVIYVKYQFKTLFVGEDFRGLVQLWPHCVHTFSFIVLHV